MDSDDSVVQQAQHARILKESGKNGDEENHRGNDGQEDGAAQQLQKIIENQQADLRKRKK